MTERAYTVAEIDDMRGYVKTSMIRFGTWISDGKEGQRVEERLRTYLLAGTEPEDLKAFAEKRYEEALAAYRAEQEWWRKHAEEAAEAEPVATQGLPVSVETPEPGSIQQRPPEDRGVDLSGPIWPVFMIAGTIILFVLGIAAIAMRP